MHGKSEGGGNECALIIAGLFSEIKGGPDINKNRADEGAA